MKPDTEHLARQLAGLVLADAGDTGRLDRAGAAHVSVELRGMTHNIRREILLDHVSLAATIADQIERQTAAVNLDQLVADRVRSAIQDVTAGLDRMVRDAVVSAVEYRISQMVESAVNVIAREATDRVLKAATEAAR